MPRRVAASAFVAVCLLTAPPTSRGADYTWSAPGTGGNPGNGIWAASANWTPAGPPGEADTAFLAAANTYQVTVQSGTAASVGNVTITNPNATLRLDTTAALTVGGTLAVGPGQLLLDAPNTTGPTLTLTGAGMTVGPGGRFTFDDGTVTGTGTVAITGGTFHMNRSTLGVALTANNGGNMATGGNKEIASAGSLTLTGGTTTAAGVLRFNGGGVVTVGPGATYQITGDHDITAINAGSPTFTIQAGGTLLQTGSGIGEVFAGPTLTNAGTIDIQSQSFGVRTTFNNSGMITTAAGRTFVVDDGTTTLNAGSAITGAGTFQVRGTPAVVTVAAAVSSTNFALGGGFGNGILNGTNTLTVTAPNGFTWSGGTAGGSATVAATAGGAITQGGIVSTGHVTLAGGTYSWSNGNVRFDGSGTLTVAATATVNVSNNWNFQYTAGAPVVTNNGLFHKTAGDGGFEIAAGVTVNNAATLRVSSGQYVVKGVVNNTGVIDLNVVDTGLTLEGSLALANGSSVTGTGVLHQGPFGTPVLTVTGTASVNRYTLAAGSVNGTGTLNVNDAFTWQQFSGGVAGSATVNANAGGTVAAGRVTTGTVNLAAGTFSQNGLIGFNGNGRVTVGAGAVLQQTTGDTYNIFSATSGNPTVVVDGTLRKAGSGGAVTVGSGVTFTNNGTVEVLNPTASAFPPTLTFDAAATLTNYTPATQTLAGGTWRADGAVLQFNRPIGTIAPGTTVLLNGSRASMPNLASLTQANGTLRLTGGAALTPTAASVTAGGTVEVGAGSTFGKALVVDGGLLTGGGTVAGAVTARAGGRVNPGPVGGTGTLTVGGGTWAGGGVYVWELNDATGTAGGATGWDLIDSAGPLTVTATPGARFVIRPTTFAGGVPGPAPNFDPAQPRTWTIATFDGGVTGFDPAAFQVDPSGFANSLNGGSFDVILSGTDVQLRFVPVPEPGAVLAVAAAGLGVAGWRRGRRCCTAWSAVGRVVAPSCASRLNRYGSP